MANQRRSNSQSLQRRILYVHYDYSQSFITWFRLQTYTYISIMYRPRTSSIKPAVSQSPDTIRLVVPRSWKYRSWDFFNGRVQTRDCDMTLSFSFFTRFTFACIADWQWENIIRVINPDQGRPRNNLLPLNTVTFVLHNTDSGITTRRNQPSPCIKRQHFAFRWGS